MTSTSKAAAIVGVAESDEIGLVPHKSALAHHAEAAHNALEDAGLTRNDVDGLLTAGYVNYDLADYLGIAPRYTDTTTVGGASFVIHVGHAVNAIANGLCEVALITHGQAGRSSRAPVPRDPNLPAAMYEMPYGMIGMPINYSMAATRYMHVYGEDRTRQAMAEIAVSTRKWAQLNPKAMMRDPMSFDDYHNSRWIAWPFHLLDCCLVTDAGAAIVVTTPERARSLPKPPVWVLGHAEHHDHAGITTMPDLTSTPARVTGPAALGMAGVTHGDIDLTMIYDSFTYTVLVTLESLGYCGPGRGAGLRGGAAHRSRRRLPAQHERRRPLLHAPRHVRHLPGRRGGAAAARRVRRAAGAGRVAGAGERHRRRALGHRHHRPGGGVMTSEAYRGPLPVKQPESDFYWEKAHEHELWLRRCNSCERAYFYPRDFCPNCGSRDVSWVRASGRGTLHTFAIVHRAPVPAFRDKVPFVVAMVDLEEGARIPTNLVDVEPDPEHIKVGMAVEVAFEDLTDEISLPVFRPA